MTISLRPHQQRILDRMLGYNKGQVIVPTGGGKTLTMIVDTQRRHDVINNGTTTVVVAPRILLAVVCSEFLEIVDTAHTHVMHVHSGETHHFSTTKSEKIAMFNNVARLLVRMLSSSPHITHCIVLLMLTLRSIRFTLTRHITVFSVTFSLPLSSSQRTQIVAISILQLPNIL